MAYADDLREHEQVLLRLLDEMGRSLARQERLLEEIENRHVQMRNSWIQEGADGPFMLTDQQALADELQRELERGRDQELELHEILDVLKRRCELEDRLLDELESHLPREHRDHLPLELVGCFERRDRLLGDDRVQIFPGEERSARGDDAAPAGTGGAALRGRGTPSRSAPPRG